MALLKTGYKNGAGVASAYWRIIDYKCNAQMKYVDMTFGGWVDEASRVANMELSDNPRKVRCMKDKFDGYFSVEALNGSDVNMLLQMYKFAKENDDFFLDATDLLDVVVEGAPVVIAPSNLTILQDKLTQAQADLAETKEVINFILMNY